MVESMRQFFIGEMWKGMKFQYRWKMDNHNGWTFRDGNILINIDGSHGVIRTSPSRDLSKKEAAAFLKAKGIPYETSINGLHRCDYDSWYFDEDKECYICDWGMPYISLLQHYNKKLQRCNYCTIIRVIKRGQFINWPLVPPRIGDDA